MGLNSIDWESAAKFLSELWEKVILIGVFLAVVGGILVAGSSHVKDDTVLATILRDIGAALVTTGTFTILWERFVTKKMNKRDDDRYTKLTKQIDSISDTLGTNSLQHAIKTVSNEWISSVESTILQKIWKAHKSRLKIIRGECSIQLVSEQSYQGRQCRLFNIVDRWMVENHLGDEIVLLDKEKWVVMTKKEAETMEDEFLTTPAMYPIILELDRSADFRNVRFLSGPSNAQTCDSVNKPKVQVSIRDENGKEWRDMDWKNIDWEKVEWLDMELKELTRPEFLQQYVCHSEAKLKPNYNALIRYQANVLAPKGGDRYYHWFKDYAETYEVTFTHKLDNNKNIKALVQSRNPYIKKFWVLGSVVGSCKVAIDRPIMPNDTIRFEWD